MSIDTLIERPWRCDVTGNPVGTDTWGVGYTCDCQGCRAADAIASKDKALSELRAELMCPIGLDEVHEICSAGSCRVCLTERYGHYYDRARAAEALLAATQAEILRLKAALKDLASAKALKGVRELVAGWNGEYRTDGPYERHRSELGATLPPTNCGAVYELDAAIVAANKLLFETRHSGRSLSQDGEEGA